VAEPMHKMWVDVFFGSNNWCGSTREGIGSKRLPVENGPWRPHVSTWLISKNYPSERWIVTDLEIIAGIEKSEYYQRQLRVRFEIHG
jgi:hypothetical protein